METQNLTPEQIEAIKRKRLETFSGIGLPKNAGQMIDQTTVSAFQQTINDKAITKESSNVDQSNLNEIERQIINEANLIRQSTQRLGAHATQDKLTRLQQIKNGANRDIFRQFVKAQDKTTAAGYQIPEPKVGKKPQAKPGQNQGPSNSVEVQSFVATKRNEEADMIERMFTNDASPSGINVTGNDYSGHLPNFDPKGTILQKISSNQPMSLKEREESTKNQLEILSEVKKIIERDQQSRRKEMEEIAIAVSKKIIKEVIEDYVKSQKQKKEYELIDKQKSIVKIGNQFFQLKPVVVKQGGSK